MNIQYGVDDLVLFQAKESASPLRTQFVPVYVWDRK